MKQFPKIVVHISTKNRCADLIFTLHKIKFLFNENVSCVVFDDGSSDETSKQVKIHFPQIEVWRNEISKGYLFCRNKMLNETKADFAISLDDDAHFLTQNPIEIIINYFYENPICGVIAARIYWSKSDLEFIKSDENCEKVKSFVGCGHVWRMKSWRKIPNYPEWFQFYGEENFAAFQLLKSNFEIQYLPKLLVQHRVDLKERSKINKDFGFRYRSALRSDWFNYLLFYPLRKIPKMFVYSIWMQLKNKIFKGNLKVIVPLILAFFDIFFSILKLIKHRNVLTTEEYNTYIKLNDAKIYWKP